MLQKLVAEPKLRVMLPSSFYKALSIFANGFLFYYLYVDLHTFIMYKQCEHSSHVCVHTFVSLCPIILQTKETNDLP